MPTSTHPSPSSSSSPSAIRLARLRRCVDELLDAARRGAAHPAYLELLALHGICVDEGAFDAAAAIRRYLGEARHIASSKPLVRR